MVESDLGVEETVESDLKQREGNAEGRWSEDEHQRFLEAHRLYGKDWRKIERHIGTRSAAQARSHAQKYFRRLNRIKNAERINETSVLSSPLPKPIEEKPEKPPRAKAKRVLNYDESGLAKKHSGDLPSYENQALEIQDSSVEPMLFPQMSFITSMQYDPYASWEKELDIENFRKRIESYKNAKELISQNVNEEEEECIGLQRFRRSRTLSSVFK